MKCPYKGKLLLPLELHYEIILFASNGTLSKLAKFSSGTPSDVAAKAAAISRCSLKNDVSLLAIKRIEKIREKPSDRQRLLFREFLAARQAEKMVSMGSIHSRSLRYITNISSYMVHPGLLASNNANLLIITKHAMFLYSYDVSRQARLKWRRSMTADEGAVSIDMEGSRILFYRNDSRGNLSSYPYISITLFYESELTAIAETLDKRTDFAITKAGVQPWARLVRRPPYWLAGIVVAFPLLCVAISAAAVRNGRASEKVSWWEWLEAVNKEWQITILGTPFPPICLILFLAWLFVMLLDHCGHIGQPWDHF